MDLGKKELSSEDTSENKKSCSDCKTTKTPLWRSGPDGPKSLCNACGIKYRKRKISMGVCKGAEKKKKRANTTPTTTTTTASATNSSVTGACVAATPTTPTTNSPPATGACVVRGLSESLKMGLMAFGKEVLLQRQRSSTVKRQKRRTMGEEEEAAVLLMALSCGSVFA